MKFSLRLVLAGHLLVLGPLALWACSGVDPDRENPAENPVEGDRLRDAAADHHADAKSGGKDAGASKDAGDEKDAGKKKKKKDAGDELCVVTFSGSGPLSGDYPCEADLAYAAKTGTALSISIPGLSDWDFVAQLVSGPHPKAITYDSSNADECGATYSDSSGGVWIESFNEPGYGETGDFAVTIDALGTEASDGSGGKSWLGAHGTASADLDAVSMDPYSYGTIHADVTWVTPTDYEDGGGVKDASDEDVKHHDAGAKDGGEAQDAEHEDAHHHKDAGDDKDAGEATDAGHHHKKDAGGAKVCTAVLSGAYKATESCSLSADYVDSSGVDSTTVTIDLDGTVSGTLVVQTDGPLTKSLYTNATDNVEIATASANRAKPDGGTLLWTEKDSDAGTHGRFKLHFTALGTQVTNPIGWTYDDEHGTYSATLTPKAKDGSDLMVHVSF